MPLQSNPLEGLLWCERTLVEGSWSLSPKLHSIFRFSHYREVAQCPSVVVVLHSCWVSLLETNGPAQLRGGLCTCGWDSGFFTSAETDDNWWQVTDYSKIWFSQVPQIGFPSFTWDRAQHWEAFRRSTRINCAIAFQPRNVWALPQWAPGFGLSPSQHKTLSECIVTFS